MTEETARVQASMAEALRQQAETITKLNRRVEDLEDFLRGAAKQSLAMAGGPRK